MRPTRPLAAGLLAAVLLLAGCQSATHKLLPSLHKSLAEAPSAMQGLAGRDARSAAQTNLAAPEAAPAGGQASEAAAAKPADGALAEPVARDRYIIRRAAVNVEVGHVREAVDRIGTLVRAHGGFVSDSGLELAEGQAPSAHLTLRVPADQFDALLETLGGVGSVRSREVSGEDVTTAFVDTQSRVRNLQREEDQLLKLLDRSGRLADVLVVERELTRVRGEIEQAQGELRHMSHLVELATITVSLAEPAVVPNPSPWQLPVVVANAWQDAQRQLASALSSVIAGSVWLFAYALPIFAPALLLYWLVGLGLRRWLVDSLALVSLRRFRQFWAIGAVVGLCAIFPDLTGWVVVFVSLGVLTWLLGAAYQRISGTSLAE